MSKPTATVDVVIPLYNGAHFIERTLRSVLGQTLAPQQVIVVDDGSTDNGAHVVSEFITAYHGPVAILLVTQPNQGPNAARNNGLRHARASYIAFVDADDVWMPTKLKKQMSVFENSPDPALLLVYCQGHWIDADDKTVDGPPLKEATPLRGHVFDTLLARNRITGSASAALVKRSAFDRAGLFDESLRTMEDFDLWLRIAEKGSIDLVQEDLVAIRTHASNNTKDTLHMLEGMLKFDVKWFDRAHGRSDVMHEWGHLIALFVSRAQDRSKAYAAVERILSRSQRRELFARAGGSLRAYVLLKRIRSSFTNTPGAA